MATRLLLLVALVLPSGALSRSAHAAGEIRQMPPCPDPALGDRCIPMIADAVGIACEGAGRPSQAARYFRCYLAAFSTAPNRQDIQDRLRRIEATRARQADNLERSGQLMRGFGIGLTTLGIAGAITFVAISACCSNHVAPGYGIAFAGIYGGPPMLVGLSIGIPLWVVGNKRIEQARTSTAGLMIAPLAGNRGLGGAMLSVGGVW